MRRRTAADALRQMREHQMYQLRHPIAFAIGALLGRALTLAVKAAIIVGVGYLVLAAFGVFDAKAHEPQTYTCTDTVAVAAPGFGLSGEQTVTSHEPCDVRRLRLAEEARVRAQGRRATEVFLFPYTLQR